MFNIYIIICCIVIILTAHKKDFSYVKHDMYYLYFYLSGLHVLIIVNTYVIYVPEIVYNINREVTNYPHIINQGFSAAITTRLLLFLE